MPFTFNPSWPRQFAELDLLDDLIQQFHAAKTGLIDAIEAGLEHYDEVHRDPMAAKIHTLKGHYRNLGFESLMNELEQCEEFTTQGQNAEALAMFKRFLSHRTDHENQGFDELQSLA